MYPYITATSGNRREISLTSMLIRGRKRTKITFFKSREVAWLIGKLLFGGLMRMSS